LALWLRLLYGALLLAALPLLVWNGFIQQINASLGDVLLRLHGPARGGAVAKIALLAIDDRTAAAYGPLPLSRATLAHALSRLAEFQPAVLVIDLLLSEPGVPEGDEALAEALGRFPKVVLGTALESDTGLEPRWILPLPAFRTSGAIGHVHASPDADGVARSVLLAKAGADRRYWALGLEAARLSLMADRPLERPDSIELGSIRIPATESENRQMRIRYAGPEGAFARVSLADLLDGQVTPAGLEGRLVVLGVTAQGSSDRLFTPLSSGLGMSGAEIHANVIRTILDRAFLVPLSPAGELLACLAVALAGVLAVRFSRGTLLLFLLSAAAAALPVACWAAVQAGWLWPLGSLGAVLFLAAAVTGGGEYTVALRALRAAEQTRKEYAFRVQSMAHEVRTPLTAIQGSAELILEPALPDRKRLEMAGLIHKESQRLNQLLETFLNVERISAGAWKLQKQPVNLRDLCDEVLERARLYAARKNSVIEGDLFPLQAHADPDLLSFAIYNLLTNAVKYSPKGARIRLCLAEDASSISIAVTDQGYGIEPEEQSLVFRKFYRLKRDASGPEPGSGLGLALVKEIAEQHGGRVIVESRPGAGSRFTLLLPRGNE
jgi:signal transduction histidine kinase